MDCNFDWFHVIQKSGTILENRAAVVVLVWK